ncbi:hypothetical protein LWP59_16245 [Amycolatopsis acidiphila]|uniref:WXG100 family type VII secretion target n=1 Tax=Amycolatopsis acidiphila TaxID=715473 RepID=A0A557ZYT4_9PSEU|nr:hypothetical protein [Amycolatopsis acidiphila]TVT17172.1 hypothetical protein FNH06_32485 [Amycolatopsis acidiphila]UIJ63067.1 hypothetical protein LWP59_16245 [Amycolatopsis acidiphila]GHG65942.1 hypothetical protein GCM10017788_23810 [Amycolatopsis acidiphila]
MSGGYTASTDAMASASKTITQLAEDVPEDNSDLQNTTLTAAGFGQAHSDHADKYTAGVQKLWDALSGYGTTLDSFGSNVGSSGAAYGENEQTQSGNISGAGTL